MKWFAWARVVGGILGAIVLAYAMLVPGSLVLQFVVSVYGFSLLAIGAVLVGLVLLAAILGFALHQKLPNSVAKSILLGLYWPLVLVAPSLAIIEGQLYLTGHKPGLMAEYSFLKRTDDFKLSYQFVADSQGITIANAAYFKQHQPQIHINADGFRGRDFADTCPGRPRLLLLGDSFLWGLAAEPLNACFANRLDSVYCTYNTGIIGADPAQYKAIAEKYIPHLKPRLTCLFVFAGNDVLYYYPKLRPGVPNYFWADGMGVSSSCYKGCGKVEYFENADTAYRFYLHHFSLYTRKGILLQAAAKTNIATQLYYRFNKPVLATCENFSVDLITRQYIDSIQTIATANGSQLVLFVIPDKNQLASSQAAFLSFYPNQFDGLPMHLPLNLTLEDYALGGDGHFNNQGHAKFAEYVQSVVDSVLLNTSDSTWYR